MSGNSDDADVVPVSGRARVRQWFIDPLVRDGLVRPPATRVGDHDAFLEQLAARLAYLDQAALQVLAEVVLALADGRSHNQWPAFATIWNTAQRISRMPQPDEERHIMTTWLVSIEGPVAEAGGYLVELYWYLRRNAAPPNQYAMIKIKADAVENARTVVRLTHRREAGLATDLELDWLERYAKAAGYCRGLVARGSERRRDKAAAAGAAGGEEFKAGAAA